MLFVIALVSFALPLIALTMLGTRLAAQGEPATLRHDFSRAGHLMATADVRRAGEFQSIQTR
ncbi:MAG: hypothetical protein Q4G43_02935 [Mobilicoccus sp.]|nr:hypothetical protein [Mobilicoccus sp.]